MKEPTRQTDVLLVGFGPVGATMANLLGEYGVQVLAIDKATEIFPKPRAISLDNEALRILQLAGLREGAFDTVAIPEVRMCSPGLGLFARVRTAGCVDGHPKLVTFHQPELEAALRNRTRQHPSVVLELGVELGDFGERGRSGELGGFGERGRWGKVGGFGGRGRWEGSGELDVLGG